MNTEWDREWQRKTSLEQRGIAVVTASGVFVTLVFGFASAVTKAFATANFDTWEKVLLGIALFFFVLSALFGVVTNNPGAYGTLPLEEIGSKPYEQIDEGTFHKIVNAVLQAREANGTKATSLGIAVGMQLFAILFLGAAIIRVVW